MSLNTRAVFILLLCWLTISWLGFTANQYFSLADNTEPLRLAGLRLALIAFVSIWLPAGLAGKGRWALLPTGLLLGLSIYCGLTLYPMHEVWHYPVRLAMHVLQCGILCCWVVNCWVQRKTSA